MIIIIPLVLLSIILSVFAVTTRAVSLARVQSLVEMSRSAINASDAILQFYYTGFNLLSTFAEDPSLLYGNPEMRMRVLETDYRVVPFFQEILLTDAQGQVISSVPAGGMGEALTPAEDDAIKQALDLGISQFTPLTTLPSGVYGLTVVWPIVPEDQDLPQGVLLGRVQLDVNPQMRRALDALQYAQGKDQDAAELDKRGETGHISHGFIVDDRGLIIAHPDQEYIMRPWEPLVPYQSTTATIAAEESAEEIETPPPSVPQYTSELGDDVGLAYEDVGPEGDRVLVYVREVEGTPYTVVLQLPFTSVLKTATTISSPLLWVQLSMGLLLLLAIPLLSTQITKPLNTLAEAANRISQGNLDIPVAISGEDEVAQLGGAFEQMRVRLQARLNDLSLLLQVSRAVSATLDMEQGVPPILQGALEETGAVVARFVLLGGAGGLGSASGLSADRPRRIFTEERSGYAVTSSSDFEALDEAFIRVLTHRKDPLIIQDLLDTHAPTSSVARVRPSELRSVASFPVRTQNRVVAILWVGADEPGAFDAARVNFLSTLSSQAAILVENARLFQAAEGGRRRLAAILASTTDCIMVTDQEGRLLMINPAGQSIWDLDARAYGRPIEDLGIAEPLVQALRSAALRSAALRGADGPSEVDAHVPPAVEVPLPDGRTFYASIAPIMGAEGLAMGQVAVMRDVTRFKELDEMKSEFVATVSHDLRAPLTFIRGYATMLMMVGELNDKQHEYLERILSGIDQMSALIGDLLNLRRIEAGVDIRQESCRLGLILVEAVDAMRARASAKNITLHLQPADGSPVVIGDSTLLRQAISNLVDNAIKYTPSGGEVSVGMKVSKKEAVIYIADTGIGISAEDQIRLFEKFHRIKRRETREVSGTGLGLALVKSIVERHGGRVWVESEMNKGSTFYIALPTDEENVNAETD
jgi:signal transduction histidine kinase